MTPEERMAEAMKQLEGCSGWPEGRCQTGKRMYRNRKEALTNKRHHELRTSMRRRELRFDAYHCKECDWWHLSSR